ncbi:hypothetical protein MMC21_007966 [Puttea exsequens]|nr:hypothetical protein [Puttea exsequens]
MRAALYPLRDPLSYLSLLVLLVIHAKATQWTVISYAVQGTYTTDDEFEPGSSFTGTTTYYLTNPSPVPTASPYSVTTDILSLSNVTYITSYLAANAVPQAVLAAATASTTSSSFTVTDFFMPVEYTAPASCKPQFTYTSSTIINVPLGAETQVTPTSTTASTLLDGDVIISAYLSPNAVPLETPLGTTGYIYSDYIASCSNPATTASYSFGSSYPTNTGYHYYSGGDDYDYYHDENCLGSLCPWWLIFIVVFCTLIPLLFIFGLFESYFWFSRFMKGRSAFRGVPFFWVAISLWTLICLRRAHAAAPQQQAALEKQWREMGTGQRMSLWFHYGFRHKNPPQVDAVMAMTPQQSMMYYAPQGQQPYYGPPGQQPWYPPNQTANGYYPPPGAAGSPPPAMQQQYAPPPQGQQQPPFYTPSPHPSTSPQPQQPYPYPPPQQQPLNGTAVSQPQPYIYPQELQQGRGLAPSEVSSQPHTSPSPVSPSSPPPHAVTQGYEAPPQQQQQQGPAAGMAPGGAPAGGSGAEHGPMVETVQHVLPKGT